MNKIARLKEKPKRELTAIYYAYKNPHLKPLPKIIIILTLGYALSPIDLIPDLIIIPASNTRSIKLIPEEPVRCVSIPGCLDYIDYSHCNDDN